MSRFARACVVVVALLTITGCTTASTIASYLPEDTKIIVRFLANDLPLPDNSSVKRSGTVITGSGSNWAGRLELTAPQTPGQLMRFFAEGAVGAGWTLKATTVSSTIILVMEKGGRGLMLLDLEAKDALAGAAAYTRSVKLIGIGRGGKDREETLEIRSLNNARAARARKGKAADLGFKPTHIVRVE